MEVQKVQAEQYELDRELELIHAHQTHMLASLDQIETDLKEYNVLCLFSFALSG